MDPLETRAVVMEAVGLETFRYHQPDQYVLTFAFGSELWAALTVFIRFSRNHLTYLCTHWPILQTGYSNLPSDTPQISYPALFFMRLLKSFQSESLYHFLVHGIPRNINGRSVSATTFAEEPWSLGTSNCGKELNVA